MPAVPAAKLADEQTLADFAAAVSTPSVFSEHVRRDLEGEGFRLWRKQIREVNREERRIKRIQGRFLGKSVTASDQFKHRCILWRKPQGTALVGTRQESNLEPIFERELITAFKKVPLLRIFLPDGDNGINRKAWQIRLLNGVTIRGRIEGKEGAGFQTIHPDVAAWWDEVQLLSDDAVAEVYGMLGPEVWIMATGVPNGVRSSWAYKIDTDASYGFAGGKMTRLDDPRMTPEMLTELANFYGGTDTSGYRNRVLGEWGDDARMTFDMDRITLDLPSKSGSTMRVKPPFYRSIELYARDVVLPDGSTRHDVLASRFAFRPDLPQTNSIYIAADHGQSASPTTGYIHFYDTKLQTWRQWYRFLLFGMQAPAQADIFHWLSDKVKDVTGIEPVIGLDTTGQGGSAVMAILEPFGHALVWVDVRAAVEDGERLERPEEVAKRIARDPFSPNTPMLVPMLQRVRQVAFPRLQQEFYSGHLRLVNEDALVKQIAGTTDTESKTGERIYSTDYTQDGSPYNHDESSFEVFGAMLHKLDVAKAMPKHDVWAQEMPVPWGLVQ